MADHAALLEAWRRTRAAYHTWMECKNELTICARGLQGTSIAFEHDGYHWDLTVGNGPYPIVTSTITELSSPDS